VGFVGCLEDLYASCCHPSNSWHINQGFIWQLLDGWPFEECSCLEDGSPMHYVVYLEGA
jgi:hypothetical protein